MFLPLDRKEPKDQGRLNRTSPRLSKRLTLRSRSAFCEGKRQAPLCEGDFCSFSLMRRNRRIKADIKGLPQLATAPPPCRPCPRALPRLGLAFPVWKSLMRHYCLCTTPDLKASSRRDPHSAKAERDPLRFGTRPALCCVSPTRRGWRWHATYSPTLRMG